MTYRFNDNYPEHFETLHLSVIILLFLGCDWPEHQPGSLPFLQVAVLTFIANLNFDDTEDDYQYLLHQHHHHHHYDTGSQPTLPTTTTQPWFTMPSSTSCSNQSSIRWTEHDHQHRRDHDHQLCRDHDHYERGLVCSVSQHIFVNLDHFVLIRTHTTCSNANFATER